MKKPREAIPKPNAPTRKAARPAKRKAPVRPTQFAYPRGWNSGDLRFSRKGKQLAEAMAFYAQSRLLPKLQARTAESPGCNHYDDVDVDFQDACVYLRAWLGHEDFYGGAEFPFARLYPVKGGRYNVSIRRLVDWSRVEDGPLWQVQDLFWNQAPNAKFWVKIATHKTFEECIDLLVADPNL